MSEGDGLHAALPRSFERLADDLVVGRHGEPHVAFAVLIYPDREPAVVAVTERGAGTCDLSKIVSGNEDDRDREGRFFSLADLEEAEDALRDALMGIRTFGYTKRVCGLGEHVGDWIKDQWVARRDRRLEAEMEKAAHDAKYAHKCEFCGSGFTERGLGMHQTRSLPCSRRKAEKEAANA